MSPAPVPTMPEMAAPQYGFRHTVDSALETLERLGVSARRITIRMAGLGWPAGWVIEQAPAAGALLMPDTMVRLSVAGLGLFHRLPVAMWERAGDGRIGTQEIVELFDDSFQKAAHWIWEGARIYNLRREDQPACGRWIELFGLRPADWPRENWHELALLLPALQRIAGREEGIRTALWQLLGLPVYGIVPRRRFLEIPAASRAALGRANRQLGIDTVIGARVEDLRALDIRLGPLTLARYTELQRPESQRRLEAVLKLTLPLHQAWTVSYEVLDRARAPRLGIAEANARLAVNSYLGQAPS
jgi:predicted component of type VI protein secretion system